MKININQLVTFTLTDYGLGILATKRQRELECILKVNVQVGARVAITEYKQTAQLWQVMEIFGEYMFIGGEQIFVDNILAIDEVGV